MGVKLLPNHISTFLWGHRRTRRSSSRYGLLLCLTVLLLTGCVGSEERAEQYLERAQQNFDAGDYVKARVDLRNVLQINDKHVAARYLFSLLYERDQNWQQMFANLQMVVELAPTHVLARLKLGALLMGSGAFEPAMKQADEVLALEPENTEGHALKAAIYFRSGDTNLAIASAQKALSLEPGNVSAITVLSQAYKADNPERALQIIEEGITQQSETALLKPPPRVICSATTLVPPAPSATLAGTSATLSVPVCPGGCVVPPSPPPHAFRNTATTQTMRWSANRAGRVALPERESRISASSGGGESGIDLWGPPCIA